ncbi:MAG: DUF1854 domain-containing protein [Eubacteriales bacterium]
MAEDKKKAPAEDIKDKKQENAAAADNKTTATATVGDKKDDKTTTADNGAAVKESDKAKTDDKKELLEDEDAGDLILENERESVPLSVKNAKFVRSEGNLISMTITNDDGTTEFFERVVILRAFPITAPDEFLSVREPDSKKMGRGKEIGMIRYMKDFDEATQRLFLEELDRRYFSPQLQKITSVKEKFGYLYWDAETDAGHVTFIMNNPFSNIRVLEDGRIIINDIDGNIFEIPDPKSLDSASYKKIEIYL